MDDKLKTTASDWAESIIQQISRAIDSPVHNIEGEALNVYNRLGAWDWWEKYPINGPEGREITKTVLTMQKYSKLEWEKNHPEKKKKTKWECVVGKRKGKNK